MTSPVLDASALLALLLDEPGADKVRAVLADALMTTVNLGEVVGHYARNGVAENDIRAVLGPLPIEWVCFDEEIAYGAGLLLAVPKPFGLSFGDRACLALAMQRKTRVLTGDQAWRNFTDVAGIQIETVR